MFRSASLFIGTSFTIAVFTIFATSNIDSIVGIPHKIYSMQRILTHIKSRSDLFVKCAHLHPGYAANLVARSRYYHCHWTLFSERIYLERYILWQSPGSNFTRSSSYVGGITLSRIIILIYPRDQWVHQSKIERERFHFVRVESNTDNFTL